MKKVVSVLLAMTIALSATACGGAKTRVTSQETPAISNGQTMTASDPTQSPVYEDVSRMLAPIEKFVEYNFIMNNTIDYSNIGSEDFWNIVAVGISNYAYAQDIADIDAQGMYHVPWAKAVDFAKTFMYDYWYKFSTPAVKSSYATSADPGSGVLDFVPLDVNNYDGKLVSITETGFKTTDDYILGIDLVGRGDDHRVYHYLVYLDDWKDFMRENYKETDKDEHILPFVVTHFDYLGYDEVIEAEEQTK